MRLTFIAQQLDKKKRERQVSTVAALHLSSYQSCEGSAQSVCSLWLPVETTIPPPAPEMCVPAPVTAVLFSFASFLPSSHGGAIDKTLPRLFSFRPFLSARTSASKRSSAQIVLTKKIKKPLPARKSCRPPLDVTMTTLTLPVRRLL